MPGTRCDRSSAPRTSCDGYSSSWSTRTACYGKCETGLSARTSSVSEPILPLARGEVTVWLSDGAAAGDSEIFLRTVLSRFTGVGGPELEIARGEQGKPFL